MNRGDAASWYGAIGDRWTVRRFKHVAVVVGGQVDPTDDRYRDMPLFAPNHMESGSGRLLSTGTADEQAAESGKYLVRAGDVLYSKIRPALRKAVVAPSDGLCSADVYAIRPSSGDLSPRFIFYLLLSEGFYQYSLLESDRVAMPKINREALGECPLVFPTIQMQRRIVDFLERKTAVIDALLAKKELVGSLLAEKRQTLITQAVTKGLDRNAPMKRSAVEWIGDLPAHWDCRRLKQVSSRIVVGIAQAATHAYSDAGVPIVRSTNVRPNRIVLDDLLYINQEFADQLGAKYVRPGDLLTVRTGNAGVTAVVPATLGRCQCFTMLITTLRRPQSAEFFSFQLNSDVGIVYFGLEGWGSAQANISVPILQNTPVAVPPIDEQRTIVEYLERESVRLETMLGAVQIQIDRLREYRQALITAAVTGKLDVDRAGSQTDDEVEQVAEGA